MYEITIYKHAHEGSLIVEEMRPFITNADVILPEMVQQRAVAQDIARSYQRLLQGDFSRQEFMEGIVGGPDDEYIIALFTMMLDLKKAMVPLEAYKSRVTKELIESYQKAKKLTEFAFSALIEGNMENAINYLSEGLQIGIQATEYRDSRINARLKDPERLLRQYGVKFKQPKINLFVNIGDYHNIGDFDHDSDIVVNVLEAENVQLDIRGYILPRPEIPDSLPSFLLQHTFTYALGTSDRSLEEIADARIKATPFLDLSLLERFCESRQNNIDMDYSEFITDFFADEGILNIEQH